jgi:hypothetical protein
MDIKEAFRMQSPVCPRCESDLIEDIIEYLEPQEGEGIKIYTFDAYVCECGHMEQVEPAPEVIAQQGVERFLLLYKDEQARILDIRDSVIWPPMHVQSILGRGYWEDYIGNLDVVSLIKNARDSRAYDLKTPNFFHISSSTESIDITFLAWLVSWSLKVYEDIDNTLHQAAVHLVSELFIRHGIPLPVVHSINHESNSLGLFIVINEKYAFFINKSDQLSYEPIAYFWNFKKSYPQFIALPICYSGYNCFDITNNRMNYIHLNHRILFTVLREGKKNGVQNQIFLDYHDDIQSKI